MVSTLAILAEFVPLPSVRVSDPSPRSMLALAIVPVTVDGVDSRPGNKRSTVLKVAVFAALPRLKTTHTVRLLGGETRDRPFCPSAWRGCVLA